MGTFVFLVQASERHFDVLCKFFTFYFNEAIDREISVFLVHASGLHFGVR
jgi:hypothetical protein